MDMQKKKIEYISYEFSSFPTDESGSTLFVQLSRTEYI